MLLKKNKYIHTSTAKIHECTRSNLQGSQMTLLKDDHLLNLRAKHSQTIFTVNWENSVQQNL